MIIPDLPPEEAQLLCRAASRADIAMVFFVAPTSTDQRIKSNAAVSSGFIYYVSVTGTTGVKQAVALSVVKQVRHIKRFTDKPVCVGFGISTPQQVKDIGRAADGVIVGSAIVKAIEQQKRSPDLVPAVCRYVSSLVKAIR